MPVPKAPERFEAALRRSLLDRLLACHANGYRDHELLYLGARYALSLGQLRTAANFLSQLHTLLVGETEVGQAYLPVGVLLLETLEHLPEAERTGLGLTPAQVREALERLSVSFPGLADYLWLTAPRNAGSGGAAGRSVLGVMEHQSLRLLHDLRSSQGQAGVASQLADLAGEASRAYRQGEQGAARLALEKMLLLHGDQPAVLRNLVTLTAEQKDGPAHDRYWRRLVKTLLWRMTRGDEGEAWQALKSFYYRVASITDRECATKAESKAEVLRRTGFVHRWLEAHAALVWLESGGKSRRDLQTGLRADELEAGQKGNLSLLPFWLRTFYPEYLPYVETGENQRPATTPPSQEAVCALPNDPAAKLVQRFLEWGEIGFGLSDAGTNPQLEAVGAMAGFVARLQPHRYLQEGREAFSQGKNQEEKIAALVGQYCHRALHYKLQEFLDAERWADLAEFFGEPDLLANLGATLRMFVAFAHLRLERTGEAFNVACQALPAFTVPELDENSSACGIWRSVLTAKINSLFNKNNPPAAIPALTELGDVLADIEVPEPVMDFQQTLLDQVDEALESLRLHQQIDQAVNQSKTLVAEGRFVEACNVIRALPDHPDDVRKLKQSLLDQINQVERETRVDRQEMARMENRLLAKGFSKDVIKRIARDNNINIDREREYYQFLKAVFKQVG